MPLFENPKFSPPQYRMLDIPEPGKGGINKSDLEFEQELNQSPNVQNMMYRNGAFGKRYGQKTEETYNGTIYDVGILGDTALVHVDEEILIGDTVVATSMPESKGLWFQFNGILYYLNGGYYQYDGITWAAVDPYAPDVVINRKPDGSYSDPIENYNRVGAAFKNTFHGDGTSTDYYLTDKNLDDTPPIVEVDNTVLSTGYSYDKTNGKISFTSPPSVGVNNVVITAYKTESDYINSILNNTHYATYGGANNSRVFLGGGGDSRVYYSHTFDATYFPESNYYTIGNSNEDVTGFGEQYDILLVFKPTEIFSLNYYVGEDGTGEFTCKQVNPTIGCDCPDTIQLINNQLVWLSTTAGVCTLVSTNIEDERNVRPLSRNINGGHITRGLLQEDYLDKAKSADWDGKYFLSVNGICYVWDYLLSPYANTGKIDTDAKRLTWYYFTNWFADQYIKIGTELFWTQNLLDTNRVVTTQEQFNDFGNPIKAVFQCPMYQFSAVPWLKTVKNIYVQCREDHDSTIKMKYITEDNQDGEPEPEDIVTYASVRLWDNFDWDTFMWDIYGLGRTHRRKCNLKKIQMASVIFENDLLNQDMSITHVAFQYAIIKNVK